MKSWIDREKERQYHSIADLFPLMQGDEFEQLKTDIAANGLQEAIWLHPDGSIIDGRNRHRACIEVEVEPPHFKTWNGEGSLVSFVVSMNLHRRHLTSSQRAVIALDAEKARAKEIEAKEHLRKIGATPEIFPESKDNTEAREFAAEIMGVNPRYISDAKRIAREAPKLLEQVRTGEKTIPQAKRQLVKRQREEVLLTAAEDPLPGSVQLICGDFAQVALTFQPNTFDAIITDPPYPKEYLHLYKLLAEQAAVLLKPGGSLLAMAGQSYLPEIYASMSHYLLNYHWTLCYATPGGQSSISVSNYKRVNTFWKPVLWFVKGRYTSRQVSDVIRSDKNDKRYHEWGQSERGMAELVEKLTSPGDLVLDPFLGGGTTAVVCHKLGREFVGVDIEQRNVDLTKGRLHESS